MLDISGSTCSIPLVLMCVYIYGYPEIEVNYIGSLKQKVIAKKNVQIYFLNTIPNKSFATSIMFVPLGRTGAKL